MEPHVDKITKVVGDYELAIKRGGLSGLQQASAWNKIRKETGPVTSQTRRDIKKILKQLEGKARTENQKKELESRKKVNLRTQMQRDLPVRESGMDKYRISAGTVGAGGAGGFSRINDDKDQPGFANQKRPEGFARSPRNAGFASSAGGATGQRPMIPLQK